MIHEKSFAQSHIKITMSVFYLKHKQLLLFQISMQTILERVKKYIILKLLNTHFQLALLLYQVLKYYCKFPQKLIVAILLFKMILVHLKGFHLKLIL